MKKILLHISILLFCSATVIAQKEAASLLPKDIVNRVTEAVKPVKDQVDKLLRDDATGQYKAWTKEVESLARYKSNAEKSAAAEKINERYAAFFKNIWASANVDEKAYQAKIRSVFPANISEKIMFQKYLNFSISISNPTTPPAPPPAPAPAPENKCIDVCSIAAGEITGEGKLIAAGAGNYGNCYLKVNSWGAVVGGNNLYGSLKNNIAIPGTLPADSRKLRVRKSFELKQEAVAFALGFGFSETRVSTYQSNEYLYAMAPVLFATSKLSSKTITEEYVIEKADVARSIIKASAGSMVYLISGSWAYSDCTNIKWTICEEK